MTTIDDQTKWVLVASIFQLSSVKGRSFNDGALTDPMTQFTIMCRTQTTFSSRKRPLGTEPGQSPVLEDSMRGNVWV